MEYKPSRFNYYTDSLDNNLILYNSFIGTSSIFKISNSVKDRAKEILNSKKITNLNCNLSKTLIDKGFLVNYDSDEEQNLKLLYLGFINSKNLHLIILPTEQCNFRCKYCYESFNKSKMNNQTQGNLITFVEKNIHNYSGLTVSWFGGEPLMALDVIEYLSEKFMNICKNHRIPYIANITSNGYLLDKRTFEKLYKLNILNYQITIDGIKQTHNQQKPLASGGDTFDVVINNMINIKNSPHRFFKIIIRTNVTKEIYNNIYNYVDFFYSRFNDDDRFLFFLRPAGDWGGETVTSFSDKLIDNRNMEQVFEALLNYNKTLNFSFYLQFLNPGGSICPVSNINSFLIDSEGTIRKCTCNLDDNKNVIGQLLENGKLQIDKSSQSQWIRLYNEYSDKECDKCFFRPCCLNNSCLADKVLGRNSTDLCGVYEKKYIDYVLKLIEKLGQFNDKYKIEVLL